MSDAAEREFVGRLRSAHRCELASLLRYADEERRELSDQVPEVNVPLLRKAVEWVREQAALPRRQSAWYQGNWAIAGEELGRECGTAYCVAGYVAQLSGEVVTMGGSWPRLVDDDGQDLAISEYAQAQLGLVTDEADALFAAANGLEDVEWVASQLAGEEL